MEVCFLLHYNAKAWAASLRRSPEGVNGFCLLYDHPADKVGSFLAHVLGLGGDRKRPDKQLLVPSLAPPRQPKRGTGEEGGGEKDEEGVWPRRGGRGQVWEG